MLQKKNPVAIVVGVLEKDMDVHPLLANPLCFHP